MHAVRARALVPTRCASSRAPSSAVRRSRPARLATRARASPSDGDDDDVSSSKRPEDDDVPPPVQLTEDQARIAAIAFEVLYEKDAAESLEEMLVDKERPGLRFKLQQAIKAANEACKGGATVECSIAWEEVDGLEDAAMRAGMTQNAPESSPLYKAPPPPPEKAGKADAKSKDKEKPKPKSSGSGRMSNPATMAGVDPLAGVMPCADESCEPAAGTFVARARLEDALKAASSGEGGSEGDASDADDETLAGAIRDAVDVAISLCESGAEASQCAVAWEVVEELSSSANRKKRAEEGGK